MTRQGLVLGIGNQKGGVGKSITSTNLSCCFARRNKRVLFIDADPQANGTSQLGMKKLAKTTGKNISQGLISKVPIEDVILNTNFENLFVVAGEIGFEDFNDLFSNKADGQFLFRQWIEPARSQFDYIIVDTHPSLDLIFRNVMIAADFFLLPLFAEPESVEGLHTMTQSISVIQSMLNPTLHPLGCIVTRYDKANDTHTSFRKNIIKFGKKHNLPLLGTIAYTQGIASASANGIPIVDFNKRTGAAKDYEKFADILVEKLVPRKKGRVPKVPVLTKQEVESFMDSIEISKKPSHTDFEIGESIEL